MSENTTFKRIPIVAEPPRRANVGRIRMSTRVAALAILILIPITGLFRIDISSGFIILDRQIWFSDFFIVFGFWLSAACLLVILYSTMGTVFCGYVCPQGTASSWANNITSRLLGKRALINWGDEDKPSRLSSGKNHWSNWLQLSVKMLGAAMLLSIIPMLYFLPPDASWAFVTLQEDARFTNSLYWIYSVFVFITLANIALMRHYVCRYMCIYRMWQYLFKTKDTLHIQYDASRSDACTKCNYCVTVCPVDIDPRNTATFDSCTNCGECITACDSLHRKHGEPGLLSYKFGPRDDKITGNNRMDLSTLTQRVSWVLPVFLLAVSLFTWGLIDYDPNHMSVYRAEIEHGDTTRDYRINIANKLYHPAEVTLRVEGLSPDMYRLDEDSVAFTTAGRHNVNLHIKDGLPKGLHTISVHAQSTNGWQSRFQIQHLVERG